MALNKLDLTIDLSHYFFPPTFFLFHNLSFHVVVVIVDVVVVIVDVVVVIVDVVVVIVDVVVVIVDVVECGYGERVSQTR